MSERRKFIKGLSLFGAVFAGAATARVVVEENPKPKEDISHLAPEEITLVLQGQRITPDTEVSGSRGEMMYMELNPTYANKVHLSVGKDNRLWIKVGEEWKRLTVD